MPNCFMKSRNLQAKEIKLQSFEYDFIAIFCRLAMFYEFIEFLFELYISAYIF